LQSTNNNGSPITRYNILVNEGVEASELANAETYATVFHNVDAYDGFSSTYQISQGDLINTHTVTTGLFYRIKTQAVNIIDGSLHSEELIIALARLPDKPPSPTFHFDDSSRFENVLDWQEGVSQDIPVSGYLLYSDLSLTGNSYLVYNGTDSTEVMRYAHQQLQTGLLYSYTL
jgi:hypothetical protein